MKVVESYAFTKEIAMLAERTNEFGELISVVIEDNCVIYVNMSKQKLLEYNLKFYGSSFRGAKDGSRAILGNIHMYPISLHAEQGIYLLPSESANKLECVWFALHGIYTFYPRNDKTTNVILTNRMCFEIPVPYKSFSKRYRDAIVLKGMMEQRTSLMNRLKKKERVQGHPDIPFLQKQID